MSRDLGPIESVTRDLVDEGAAAPFENEQGTEDEGGTDSGHPQGTTEEGESEAAQEIEIDGERYDVGTLKEALSTARNYDHWNRVNTQRAQNLAEQERMLREQQKELMELQRQAMAMHPQTKAEEEEAAEGFVTLKQMRAELQNQITSVREERQAAERERWQQEYARNADLAIRQGIESSQVLNKPKRKDLIYRAAVSFLYDNGPNADLKTFLSEAEATFKAETDEARRDYVKGKTDAAANFRTVPPGGGPVQKRQERINNMRGFERFVDTFGRRRK